jgi:hypothetical protein
MTARVVAIGKGIFLGWLLGSLIGVVVVLTIGTICIAAGLSQTTVGLGPVPIATGWSNASGFGLHSEWGMALFTIAGMIVGAVLAIRPKALPKTA